MIVKSKIKRWLHFLTAAGGEEERKREGESGGSICLGGKKSFSSKREDGGKRAECEHFFPLSRRKIYSFARRECSSFLSSLNKAEENLAGWISPGNETTMHFIVLSPWSSGGSSLHGRIPFLQKKSFRAAVLRMSKRERDSRHFALLRP